MSTTTKKGTALITGASAGIGAIYADRLAKRDYDLILVARNQSRLTALAQRLKNETGRSVETIAADLNDKMDEIIRLNVGALTRLTYAAVPGFVARGGGTIVNISSMVAISPETLNGVYGGSKAFVLAFSQSLQHELGQKGVRVQAVLPGATATEFWDIAGLPVHNLPTAIVMSAEDMVDAALAGLDQGEA